MLGLPWHPPEAMGNNVPMTYWATPGGDLQTAHERLGEVLGLENIGFLWKNLVFFFICCVFVDF